MSRLADATIAISEVAIDPAPPRDMLQIVRAGEGCALGDAEVRFDGVEPRGLGRRPHGVDTQPAEQRQGARRIVNVVQVIHDDDQPAVGIAGPQAPEGLAHVGHSLAPPKQSAQTVGVDVVEATRGSAMGRTTYLPTPTPCGTLPAGEPADRLDAFFTEHGRCGDLDAGVDDVIVWIACDCGASMARRADESYRARD
jgi:hypothetical protein